MSSNRQGGQGTQPGQKPIPEKEQDQRYPGKQQEQEQDQGGQGRQQEKQDRPTGGRENR